MGALQQRWTGGHVLSSKVLPAFPNLLLGASFYLFMNEYKTNKYIREKTYRQLVRGGQGGGGQNSVHLSTSTANWRSDE